MNDLYGMVDKVLKSSENVYFTFPCGKKNYTPKLQILTVYHFVQSKAFSLYKDCLASIFRL